MGDTSKRQVGGSGPERTDPSNAVAERTIRYQMIADDLRRRVLDEEFVAGRLLPSESELSASYEASRATVRRALESLRGERLVDSRQGFGWFVAADPLRLDLGRLDTIERQLGAAGLRSERRILDFGFVAAPPKVREILGGRQVLEVRRVNLADGSPFALVTVWCPEVIGAHLSRDDVERSSFLELLRVELGGANQTIGADAAHGEVATLLEVPVGSPVLVVQRVTRSAAGRPVLVSRHIFPAHRTEFDVELPVDDGSMAPSGLRLIE